MRCDIFGYQGAVHLVKLRSSMNVAYGMQLAPGSPRMEMEV